jgi:hypothetical protein
MEFVSLCDWAWCKRTQTLEYVNGRRNSGKRMIIPIDQRISGDQNKVGIAEASAECSLDPTKGESCQTTSST